jgi:hypothetical protein
MGKDLSALFPFSTGSYQRIVKAVFVADYKVGTGGGPGLEYIIGVGSGIKSSISRVACWI